MNATRKLEYDIAYLNMAACLRPLSYAKRSQVGCLIISEDDQIIAQGYNGMPKGFPNVCEYEKEDGVLVTKDEVLHAESNAIAKCAKSPISTINSTAYVTLSPCLQCAKLLLQSGVKRVVFMEEYRDLNPIKFLINGGIEVQCIDILHKKVYNYNIEPYSEDIVKW